MGILAAPAHPGSQALDNGVETGGYSAAMAGGGNHGMPAAVTECDPGIGDRRRRASELPA